jgi:hypothetical protein
MNDRTLTNTQTLPEIANKINSAWADIDEHEGAANDSRIKVGHLLLEAKDLTKVSKIKWEAWCAEHVKRSQGDIRKVMALAKAPDAEAAHEAERQSNREARAVKRASMRGSQLRSVRAHATSVRGVEGTSRCCPIRATRRVAFD